MRLDQLEAEFERLGINYQEPGFYDTPAFLAVEQMNPQFLSYYAEYVDRRTLTAEYVNRVRELVPRLAQFVFERLRSDGRLGACVDISGMLCRMLDLEGVWAYSVGGGVTVRFPGRTRLDPSHFGMLGGTSSTPGAESAAGHMWIRVPPYQVLDITLAAQPMPPERALHLTDIVLAERSRPKTATVEQLVDQDLIEQVYRARGRRPTIRDVVRDLPHLVPFMQRFPAFSVNHGEVAIDYAPVKIYAVEEPLAGMTHPILNGVGPQQMYQAFRADLRVTE